MTPFCTATPNRAMKPTEALTLRCWPDTNKATIPPIRAKGMFMRIKADWLTEPKVPNSSAPWRPFRSSCPWSSL
ncbi:hypothetical protein D3C72_2507100 [compost metagenome]